MGQSVSPVPTPNLDRVRRQVMSNKEADEVARYIELLQERVRVLCAYVKEAAGDESCLLPVSTLSKLFFLTDEEREAVLYATRHMIHSSGACRPSLEKRRLLESAQERLRCLTI